MGAVFARVGSIEEFGLVVNWRSGSLDQFGDTQIGVRTQGDIVSASSFEFVDGFQDISFFDVETGEFPWETGDPELQDPEPCVHMTLGTIAALCENDHC